MSRAGVEVVKVRGVDWGLRRRRRGVERLPESNWQRGGIFGAGGRDMVVENVEAEVR